MEKRKSLLFKKIMSLAMAFFVLAGCFAILPGTEQVDAASKNRIELYKSRATLYAGEYTTIRPAKVYQNGVLVQRIYEKESGGYSWLDNSFFKFKSSNSKVATVSKKGVVTAKKKGTAKITVTHIYNSKIKATFKITVKAKPKTAKLTLESKKATIVAGNKTTIKIKKLTGVSNKGVKYTSSNKKIATVSSKGVVKGVKAGTATITVQSTVNKKVKATFKVTVKSPDQVNISYSPKGKAKITLKETSVTLAPAKSFIACNNPEQTKMVQANKKKYGQAQIEIQSITGLKSTAVTYQSSNPSVASVSATGFVTPKKKGTATITVTSKENKKVKATYQVTVRNLATWIDVAPYDEISLSEGREDLIRSGTYFASGSTVEPANAECREIIAASSDESVIRIEYDKYDGILWAVPVKKGMAEITISTADGYASYTWKVKVVE